MFACRIAPRSRSEFGSEEKQLEKSEQYLTERRMKMKDLIVLSPVDVMLPGKTDGNYEQNFS